MQHADEGQIHAYLDRQLEFADPERRREMGRHIADCGRCTKLLIEARRLRSGADAILTAAPVDEVKPPTFRDIVERAKSLQPLTPPAPPSVDEGGGPEAGTPVEADEESDWVSEDQPAMPIAESPENETGELTEAAGDSFEDETRELTEAAGDSFEDETRELSEAAGDSFEGEDQYVEPGLGVDVEVPDQAPASSSWAPTLDQPEIDDQPDVETPDFELSIPTPEEESPTADVDGSIAGMGEEPPPAETEPFESVPDLDIAAEIPVAEDLGVPELVSDFDLTQDAPDIELTPHAGLDEPAPAASTVDRSAHVGDMPLIANDFDSQMFAEPQPTDAESSVEGSDPKQAEDVSLTEELSPPAGEAAMPPTAPEPFDLVAEMDQLEIAGPIEPPVRTPESPDHEGAVQGRERLASMPEIELETDSLLSSHPGEPRDSVDAAGISETGSGKPESAVAGAISPARAKKPGGMRWMALAASVIIAIGAGWIARPWLFGGDAGDMSLAQAPSDTSLLELAAEPAARTEAEGTPSPTVPAARRSADQPSRETRALAAPAVADSSAAFAAEEQAAPRADARRATSEIAGSIVESGTSRPLAGAQVLVVGTDLSATTGADGRYRIAAVPAGAAQVRARLVGYTTEERAVNLAGGETVGNDFTLERATIALDEVVVTPPEQGAAAAARAREQPSAAAPPPEAERMTPGEWSAIDRAQAEELLNGPLVAVVGLPIETIAQAATGQRIVLVEQTLPTGERLELEIRIGVGNRNLQDTDQSLRPTAVLARSVSNGARGTASIGQYTITARAPISEADLTTLLGRLAEAPRSD